MQTSIIDALRDTPDGEEANRILRACTHCGFCTATCPTYQLTGDERDGPRGRIYLIKQVLEGAQPTSKTQLHLDRCLTCRACETTCPSGVEYGKLADIGRGLVDAQVPRSTSTRLTRWLLRQVIPHRRRFGFLLAIGRLVRPALRGPLSPLRRTIPARRRAPVAVPGNSRATRRMLVLDGCVQPGAAPATNAAAAQVLARFDIALIAAPRAGCCGALSRHLSARAEADDYARANIDAWWPHIEAGAEAIVITASGCGAEIADYGHILHNDPAYADRAATVSAMTRDLSDILASEDLRALGNPGRGRKVAYHPPCTLQNAPALHDHVATILTGAGFRLTPVADEHLCCGSAGTYSLLQPAMARQLRSNKLANLTADEPDVIVTANIGCQLHLDSAATVPVRHWIELLAQPDVQ